jgi:hypothetical protein
MRNEKLHKPKKVWNGFKACVYCSKLKGEVVSYPCENAKKAKNGS